MLLEGGFFFSRLFGFSILAAKRSSFLGLFLKVMLFEVFVVWVVDSSLDRLW